MKQNYMKRQIEIQNTKSIRDALSETHQTTRKVRPIRPIVIAYHLCRGAGSKLCTGPPGRAPSRGDPKELPPNFYVDENQLPEKASTKNEYLYNPFGQDLKKV